MVNATKCDPLDSLFAANERLLHALNAKDQELDYQILRAQRVVGALTDGIEATPFAPLGGWMGKARHREKYLERIARMRKLRDQMAPSRAELILTIMGAERFVDDAMMAEDGRMTVPRFRSCAVSLEQRALALQASRLAGENAAGVLATALTNATDLASSVRTPGFDAMRRESLRRRIIDAEESVALFAAGGCSTLEAKSELRVLHAMLKLVG